MSHDESHADQPDRKLEITHERESQLPAQKGPHDVEVVANASGESTPTGPVRLIDKFKLANLRSKKELEAVAIVLDARIDELRHQADAASRESKAYWDGKTAEVVSAMKTFVQAKLRGIENERMASRFDSLESAYNNFAAKVREVEAGSLPEELRESLIRKMHVNLTETIERLENDRLADTYDLKD